jgi:hypothetical protein
MSFSQPVSTIAATALSTFTMEWPIGTSARRVSRFRTRYRSEKENRSLDCEENVGKRFARFRRDRFLADPNLNWSVCRGAKHDIRCIVGQGATVPLDKAKRCFRANGVGKHIWEQPMRDLFSVRVGIFGRSICANNIGHFLSQDSSVCREVVGRAAGIEVVSECATLVALSGGTLCSR